jgi:Uncharacterized protein conserved in bacteria (DUF2252)
VMFPRSLSALSVIVALSFGVAAGTGRAPRAPSAVDADSWLPTSAGALPPALASAIRNSPYAFFRLVNRSWASRVCAEFAGDRGSLVPVRLHGDAHVEQYAVTDVAYGLDDFDDTAEGPAVIDVVRFLGSLRLAARERSWTGEFDRVASAFLRGYHDGLTDPAGLDGPMPRIVRRLRQRRVPDTARFLAWADALMKPVTPPVDRATRRALDLLAAHMTTGPHAKAAGFFRIKRFGRVSLGIGSRRLPKLLIRVEGPSPAANDDVILEAKEPANLIGIECLQPAQESDAVRVIAGTQQIGRLKHDVLSLVPSLIDTDGGGHRWWIHDWTPSYVEVDIHDLRSVAELSELAEDSGRQLGRARLPITGPGARQRRDRARQAIAALDPRVRQVTIKLTDDLLRAWAALRR